MSEQLLNQGGYGCVYFPAKSCSTGVSSGIENIDFVTKVQMKDSNIEQEREIGEVVKKIANYSSFFAPVIETCPVKEKDINSSLLDKNGNSCNIIKKAKERNKSLVMMRIPYLPDGDFKKHITTNSIAELLACYRHLLLGIEHLINRNIVHYDLKADNILFNRRLNNPIIIDFGLSIDMTKIFKNNNITSILKKYFYVYEPKYSLWPLDVHLLCLIADKLENISMKEIENMCINYVINAFKDSTQLSKTKSISKLNTLTPLQKNFYDKSIAYYSKFADKSIGDVILALLKYWNTWDLYGLHYMFYKRIIHTENKSLNDIFTPYIHELMKEQIDPDPTKRKTASELMDKILEIYYLSN
tara:strand:+ start:16324 stop:17394 length:1071 start_codon:yes stop_codon:yes gene_type:complete